VLRDIATLMLQTDMRPSEVHRIQPTNVHLNGGYLASRFGKAKAAQRRVRLTAVARGILARRIAESDGWYFFRHDTDGDRPTPELDNAHVREVRNSKDGAIPYFRPKAHMSDQGY
jgi:integrase